MADFVAMLVAMVMAAVAVAVIAFILAIPMYFLWNWLMPELFALKQITYLQAWGLVFLTGLLFKNGGAHSS